MPICAIITPGTTADCTQANALIRGISAEHLLAALTRRLNSGAIVKEAQGRGMQVVIPPRRHRKTERSYDDYL